MYKSVNRILSTKTKQIQASKKTCEKYQEKKKQKLNMWS